MQRDVEFSTRTPDVTNNIQTDFRCHVSFAKATEILLNHQQLPILMEKDG